MCNVMQWQCKRGQNNLHKICKLLPPILLLFLRLLFLLLAFLIPVPYMFGQKKIYKKMKARKQWMLSAHSAVGFSVSAR